MRRRDFIVGLASAATRPRDVFAQGPDRRPLIAILVGAARSAAAPWVSGFPQGMQELGYVQGRNFDIEARYADGELDRQPALAEELVRIKPHVIMAGNISAAVVAKQATSTIPILCPALVDPIGFGLVASEARPGGNVTGILSSLDGLPGKQLEVALEVIPGARRAGMLVNTSNRSQPVYRRAAEAAAAAMLVALVPVEVRVANELDVAFETFSREQVEIVLMLQDPMFLTERRRIAALALAARLPTMYAYREHVEDGGLLSYGIDLQASWRRLAGYVDKILHGTKPGDLPVELPTKLDFAINLKTAKTLGIRIPPTVLIRADKVIE